MNDTEVIALSSIATLMEEIERLRDRLARVERENRALNEQLAFYRRRVAA
ncbi:MAG TPA: hypothetical protein VEA38_03855 [Terriglobales bacterium]|nr:hypothetical protein [Terriglobales bacterium]